MELLALAAVAGGALVFNEANQEQPNAFNANENLSPNAYVKRHVRDIRDAGDVYHVQGRSLNQAHTMLNFAWIPISAPNQEPTYSINDVITSRAENTAQLESQQPAFTFLQNDVLGIHYGAPNKNNGYNIGIPYEGVSFAGDPGYSLAKLPKVFIDRYEYNHPSDYHVGYQFDGDGEPTMHYRAELPNDADLGPMRQNPYGPHGYYQKIIRSDLMDETIRRGNIKPGTIKAPSYGKRATRPEQFRRRNIPFGVERPY